MNKRQLRSFFIRNLLGPGFNQSQAAHKRLAAHHSRLKSDQHAILAAYHRLVFGHQNAMGRRLTSEE